MQGRAEEQDHAHIGRKLQRRQLGQPGPQPGLHRMQSQLVAQLEAVGNGGNPGDAGQAPAADQAVRQCAGQHPQPGCRRQATGLEGSKSFSPARSKDHCEWQIGSSRPDCPH